MGEKISVPWLIAQTLYKGTQPCRTDEMGKKPITWEGHRARVRALLAVHTAMYF